MPVFQHLNSISYKSTWEYEDKKRDLIDFVNNTLLEREDLAFLIGSIEAKSIMFTNHKNHIQFMKNVFYLNDYELLDKTIPWVYKAYSNHGFSFDYFLVELEAWIKGCELYLSKEVCKEILPVYYWMIDEHVNYMNLAQKASRPSNTDTFSAIQKELIDLLINGNSIASINYYKNLITQFHTAKEIYSIILSPILEKIGELWESGTISVAQEHLASAQIIQIMTLVSHSLLNKKLEKGIVVVSTPPKEIHEIPSWMVANILEEDGWDCQFLGSNTPPDELFLFVKKIKPKGITLSTTMSFHIYELQKLVNRFRKDKETKDIPIIIGGYAFKHDPSLIKHIPEALYAEDLQKTVKLANEWFR